VISTKYTKPCPACKIGLSTKIREINFLIKSS
jgi:hypothetical protein